MFKIHKKMNKQIKYVMLFATAVLIMSCNDEFLERYPLTEISDGSYWNSANDLKIYINTFYNNDKLLPHYQDYSMGNYGIDAMNGSDTYVYVDYNTRMNGEGTVPTSGGGWEVDDWKTLRSLNYFMANYHKATDAWEICKPYVGEALFFRTLFYFNKLRDFGDIPYTSTVLNNDSKMLFESRMRRNQVVDSLMHDMDRAVEYLPARTSTWTGRLNKETAMLLQARIALYEGTWEKYHALKSTPFKVEGSDGSKFIQKAAQVSGALMTLAESNGMTALSTDVSGHALGAYNHLFIQKDYSSNKEVLFWRKYEVGVVYNRIVGALSNGGGSGLTKSMVDSYLCIDGKPILESNQYKGDNTLKDVVANRDPRLSQTINVDDGKHVAWTQSNSFFEYPRFEGESATAKSITGYQLYKGFDGDQASNSQISTQSSPSCGLIYFRYAEALLIYAEAQAELGVITQADIDKTINALRARAGKLATMELDMGLLDMNAITTDPNWLHPDLSPLLNEIRRERTVELVCEGFRVDDIFRWAAADELLRGYIPQGAVWEQWRNYPGAIPAFVAAWTILPVDADGCIAPYLNLTGMRDRKSTRLNSSH